MSELADVVPSSNNHENENEPLDGGGTAALLVRYRLCRPTDIPVCAALEAASYPVDEAATTSTLQYRQHHAARYFWCAVVAAGGAFGSATTATTMTASEEPPDVAVEDCDDDTVIGFVCGTKCHTFTNESMSAHEPTGQLLAIHSVVVAEAYRKRKIATHMLQTYIQKIAAAKTEVEPDDQPITKIVLLSKAHLLAFYVICGFQVLRPSAIEHGNEQWYDLESDVAKMAAANAEEQYRYPTCFIVDAFVDPFAAAGTTGNSAAVVPLDSEPSATGSSAGTDQVQWMQTVAREFNLSETAFVWKKTKKQKTDETTIEEEIIENNNNVVHYGIRYFTPSVEVALCGHATLASAAVLYQTQSEKQQQKAAETSTIIFHAPNDVLQASQSTQTSTCNDESNRCTRISMTFPTKPATELSSDEERMAVRRMLRVSLNLDEGEILYMGLSEGLGDLLIEVTRSGFLRIGNDHRQLNFNALLEWDGYTRGVIVCCQEVLPSSTQQGDDGEGKDLAATAPALISVDFLSRFFGPKAGIPEDPVTGSAHCALAPYFCSKLGKPVVIGRQMSQRGGLVECELADDLSSVKLTGTAIITMTGTLWV